MSVEYWLVTEAVPYFTKRLGGDVSFSNGARMFQLLFAAGWEPTKTHYSEIPDVIWRMHENDARARVIRPITFSLMPPQSRLPDKQSIPQSPQDSMIPVGFHTEKRLFIVPLIADVGYRNNDSPYLQVYFDHGNQEGPYFDETGHFFEEGYECGGDQFAEFLLPSLSEECEETDFDDALREFLFDRVSGLALKLGTQSFYKGWNEYLVSIERENFSYTAFTAEVRGLRDEVTRQGGSYALAVFNAEVRRIVDHFSKQASLSEQEKHRQALRYLKDFAPRSVESAQQAGYVH